MENFLKPYQKQELSQGTLEIQYTRMLTENTKKTYKKAICDFFQVIEINDITKSMIQSVSIDTANEYMQYLIDKKLSSSSINLKMSALKNFFSFMTRRDIKWADYNPFDTKEGCARLKNQKDYSTSYCATEDDAQKMISVCSENSPLNIRNKIVIMLMATTGLRRSEVQGIKIKDISVFDGRYICLIHGKGKKDRYCEIALEIYLKIQKYMEMRQITFKDEEEYLIINHSHNYENSKVSLQTINNIVKDIAIEANANPEKLSCHSMRRFFATESFKMGVDIRDLQSQLGHSNVSTTQMYIYHDNLLQKSKTNSIYNKIKGASN